MFNHYKSSLSEFYDQRADTYDQSSWHREICNNLLHMVTPEKGEKVLDVGTGTGFIALEALKQVGDSGSVLGIDISSKMLEIARAKAKMKNNTGVEFKLADAEGLALPKESFDVIYCANTFPWFEDKAGILRFWFEALKSGGRISFHMPSNTAYISQVFLKDAYGEFGVSIDYSNRTGDIDTVKSMITDSGFSNIDSYQRSYGRYVSLKKVLSQWKSLLDLKNDPLSPSRINLPEPGSVNEKIVKERYTERAIGRCTSHGVWDDMETWFFRASK